MIRRVEDAEGQHMKHSKKVTGRFRKVNKVEEEVGAILSEGDQQIQSRCLGRCHKKCRSAYKFGKKVMMSRDPDVVIIQDKIGKKLRFPEHTWSQKDQQEKASEIFSLLNQKRFVMICGIHSLIYRKWESLIDNAFQK